MEAVDIFIHNFLEACWTANSVSLHQLKGIQARGGRDAKFCVNVDVCISSKPFFFFDVGVGWSAALDNLKIQHIFTVCCDNVTTTIHSSCPFHNLVLTAFQAIRLKKRKTQILMVCVVNMVHLKKGLSTQSSIMAVCV